MKTTTTSIPLRVQASAAIARSAHYAGDLTVSRLRRVVDCLASDQGVVHVDLKALKAADGTSHLQGRISGEVEMRCQRCLQVYRQPLVFDLDLRLVSSEAEEARLMRECEPYLLIDDNLPLQEVIEDEVMLALPLAPHCSRLECSGGGTG